VTPRGNSSERWRIRVNVPRFETVAADPASARVSRGYGILQTARRGEPARRQPVAIRETLWRRAGHRSVYADGFRRLSDVFGEGSFIGKGIYDVDAFEHALAGRLPLNRILSHDLLEGCYARAGLLSDEQLYEEFPSRYSADVRRRHRWIRGDWQVAGWILRVSRSRWDAGTGIRCRHYRDGKFSTICGAVSFPPR